MDVIPKDPARPEYRLGSTLGDHYSHWFRAKLFQQYRLFFRYHAPSRIIVYVWVDDDDTRRAYESRDDAYRMFRKMLEGGSPPDDWDQLMAQAQGAEFETHFDEQGLDGALAVIWLCARSSSATDLVARILDTWPEPGVRSGSPRRQHRG